MKEIYILNSGENIDKIKYQYKITEDIKIKKNELFNFEYIEPNFGEDEVFIVKNYMPYIIYKVNKNESALDIMARGFDIGGICNIYEGDILVLSKPKSLKHIVKPLETIDSICKQYKCNKDILIESNKIKNENIFIGQILWI